MVGIFDRYLLICFVRVWAIAFSCFFGLYVVVDLFNNLDEFLGYGERMGGVLPVLCQYYGPRMLAFADRVSALLSLMAALFVLAWLQRTNEWTALEGAGVSPWRSVRPLIAAAVMVSALAVGNREMLIPRFREQLSRNAQDWFLESSRRLIPRYDNQTDIYLQGKAVLLKEHRIEGPIFRLPPGMATLGRELQAEEAIYETANDAHPAGYRLRKVTVPQDIAQRENVLLGGRVVVYTPRETPWLQPDECFVVSQVDVQLLVATDAWRRYASTAELVRALHNAGLDYGADVRVTVHSRLVQPVLDLLLFLIGMPIVLAKRIRNVYVAVGHCVLVVVAFLAVVLACQALGTHYLISPALAAWCPILICTPVAYWVVASTFGGNR